jgi:hypothetical protein
MKRLILIVVPLVVWALLAMTANASDHIDTPSLVGDRATDLSDVYAFRSTENGNDLVFALNVNGATAPAELRNFAAGVEYKINVDTNADLVADATIKVTFSGDLRTFKVEGLGAPITGEVTPPGSAEARVTEANGTKVFAGPRNDPFFQDALGVFGFIATPYVLPATGLRLAGEPPSSPDDLGGFGPVSSIVIELPITALTKGANSNTGTIKAWFSTWRGGAQVDRMAIPDNNNFLMPPDQKEAFNRGEPANDSANFRAIARARIEHWRAGVDAVLGPQHGGPLGDLTPEQAAAALIPDVLTIDFSKPLQFPNGRRLQDDESDIELGTVLNRGGAAGMSDAVDGPDKPYLTSFPYLAAPKSRPSVSTAPNAGTGGSERGDGTLWLLFAGALAGIALLSSGFVLRRASNWGPGGAQGIRAPVRRPDR